jgi:hypothetical protein
MSIVIWCRAANGVTVPPVAVGAEPVFGVGLAGGWAVCSRPALGRDCLAENVTTDADHNARPISDTLFANRYKGLLKGVIRFAYFFFPCLLSPFVYRAVDAGSPRRRE